MGLVKPARAATIRRGTTRTSLRRRCDRLWSERIRQRGKCAHCGASGKPLEAAHIVPRRFYRTRWDLENGRPLCPKDHAFFTRNEAAFRNWIGAAYDELWQRAQKPWDRDYVRVLESLRE